MEGGKSEGGGGGGWWLTTVNKKLWDRTESSFCQGAGQSTVSVVCSQDFPWRNHHYCIQTKGRV